MLVKTLYRMKLEIIQKVPEVWLEKQKQTNKHEATLADYIVHGIYTERTSHI